MKVWAASITDPCAVVDASGFDGGKQPQVVARVTDAQNVAVISAAPELLNVVYSMLTLDLVAVSDDKRVMFDQLILLAKDAVKKAGLYE